MILMSNSCPLCLPHNFRAVGLQDHWRDNYVGHTCSHITILKASAPESICTKQKVYLLDRRHWGCFLHWAWVTMGGGGDTHPLKFAIHKWKNPVFVFHSYVCSHWVWKNPVFMFPVMYVLVMPAMLNSSEAEYALCNIKSGMQKPSKIQDWKTLVACQKCILLWAGFSVKYCKPHASQLGAHHLF